MQISPAAGWGLVWAQATINVHLLEYFLREVLDISKKRSRQISLGALYPILLMPFSIDAGNRFFRGIFSLGTWYYSLRAHEALTDDDLRKEGILYRMAHSGYCFHDIRLRRPLKEPLEDYLLKSFIGILRHLSIIALSLYVINHAGNIKAIFGHYFTVVFVSIFGGFYGCSSLYILGYVINFMTAPFGLQFPKLMDNPEEAESVAEFWIRWDTVVQQILKRYVFDPLMDKSFDVDLSLFTSDEDLQKMTLSMSRDLCSVITFLASGVLHTYPLFIAGLKPRSALFMMTYFLLQVLLIKIERKVLKIRKQERWVRKVWTYSAILLPGFLFLKPVFELAGVDI